MNMRTSIRERARSATPMVLLGLASIAGAIAGCTTPSQSITAGVVDGDRRAQMDKMLEARQADKAWVNPDTFKHDIGFDSFPPEVQAKMGRTIAKKLNAGPTTGGADAIDFFMHQRLPDGEEYPIEYVREVAKQEYAKAEARAAARRQRRGSDDEPYIDGWRELGPGNVGGRTRAMVISPDGAGTGDDKDPGFMLAAGVGGGVFKSTDGGASWRPTADLLDNIAISTLAMDPTDPNIIYAGTGEGFSNDDAIRGMGIFKSTDAGESWQFLESTQPPAVISDQFFYYVNKIAISPADPDRIYVAARSGVWVHTNGGIDIEGDDDKGIDPVKWELKLRNSGFSGVDAPAFSIGSFVGATDIQIRPPTASGVADPVEEELVIAAFGGFIYDGLYVSPNGGEDWFLAPEDDSPNIVFDSDFVEEFDAINSIYQGRMTIAFGPRNSASDGVVYVLVARNEWATQDADPYNTPIAAVLDIFRADLSDLDVETDDDTDEPTSLSLPFESRLDKDGDRMNRALLSNLLASGICGSFFSPGFSQGWYDNIIKVDPADEDVVWVGGIDLFRSDDGGENFGLASYWYFEDDEPSYVHADQHEIVFDPAYNGTTNTTMYVTNDGGIYRTDNARADVATTGCPFDLPDSPDDVVESEVVFRDLNNGYGVTQFYHGATGTSVDGTRGRDLYVGGTQDNGTVRSLRRSCTEGWHEILGGDGGYVAVDPTDNNIIYAETQNFGNIYRNNYSLGTGDDLTDVGEYITVNGIELIDPDADPSTVVSDLSVLDNGLFITPMALDPNDPTILWTGGRRPWRLDNADTATANNSEWTVGPNFNIPGAPPQFDSVARISAIAIAPSNSDIVYMGTEDGYIFRTENGTDETPEWEFIFVGLPDESGYISSIAVNPNDPDDVWVTNSRFTDVFDPFDPNGRDFNLYRSAQLPDDHPTSPGLRYFLSMQGTVCNMDGDFSAVLPDLPAHWVALRTTEDCDDGECLVFVGTEIGVYVSQDAFTEDTNCDPDGPEGNPGYDSVTWELINTVDFPFDPDNPDATSPGSLPTAVVETLAFRDDNTIVAFTHGRGAFLANILREVDGVPENEPCSAADLVAPFGVIDSRDQTAFISDWTLQLPSADMPVSDFDGCGDGDVDLQDLSRFIELFGAGCPSGD